MTPGAPPTAEARHAAHLLDPSGRGTAFVLHPDRILAAPTVLDLVEGVWHRWPRQAHTLLRPRIHSTRPASDLDRAVVKLCARKLTGDVPTTDAGRDERPVVDLSADAAASRAAHIAASGLPLAAAARPLADLVASVATGGPLATRARPVVALLYDADGTLLDAARNTHGTHRLHHAEVNLVQRWQARHGPTLPPGAQVVVSLQCCRMCAALLVDAAPHGIDVAYLEPETGRFGRHTALQARGWERPL